MCIRDRDISPTFNNVSSLIDRVKFKQGQIAYKASVFMGGNVVARNGFIRVKNPSA